MPYDLSACGLVSVCQLRAGSSANGVAIANDSGGVYMEVDGTVGTRALRIQIGNTGFAEYSSLNVNGNTQTISFNTSNAERIRIASGGNVGIGTASPGTNLEVFGTDAEMMVHYTGNSRGGFRAMATQRLAILTTASSDSLVFGYESDFKGAFTERMRIVNSTGRVGIGTASPSTMLQVCGDVSGENAAWVQNTNSAGYGSLRALNNLNCAAVFGVGGSAVGAPYANTGYLYTDANVNFVFSIGTTEKMRINSTGNVGIACTSPGSKLTVGGTLTTTDTITTTSGTVSNYLTYTATTGVIGTQTNHALQIRTNDTERIRVTCTGCIGVNITSPTYTLHVNGTFYAAGSSKEYKTSICEYNTDSCMFMKLKPVTYDYKEEWKHLGKQLKSGTQIGLIAEDTAEVFPELAVLKEEENQQVVRNVDYEKLSVILLSEVQKLRREVDDLKHK